MNLSPKNRGLVPAVGLGLLLAVIGLWAYFAGPGSPAAPTSPARATISQSALEEQYGLRVTLVAVTAAGGMLDVRLKLVDPEKARALLEERSNFPAVWVAKSGQVLSVPEETKAQPIKFEQDAVMFILFSNTGGLVQPGDAVSVLFGDLQLEPINAR